MVHRGEFGLHRGAKDRDSVHIFIRVEPVEKLSFRKIETFEWAVNYLVDKIDISVFAENYHNDELGAAAYSPRTLLKIILYCYSKGILSSRKEEQDSYICPEGKILNYKCRVKLRNNEGKQYRARSVDCNGYILQGKCITRNASKKQGRALSIVDKKDETNLSEEMKKKIDTPVYRELYSRRIQIIEPVYLTHTEKGRYPMAVVYDST